MKQSKKCDNMRKLIFMTMCVVCMCSCATYTLNKSVWYNLTFVEKDEQKVDMTTSLHFISDNQVDVFLSVVSDSNFIVEPFKYAEGTYSVSGNAKKEAKISIEATTIDKTPFIYKGVFHKYDAMILMSSDSIVKVYGKLPQITLP